MAVRVRRAFPMMRRSSVCSIRTEAPKTHPVAASCRTSTHQVAPVSEVLMKPRRQSFYNEPRSGAHNQLSLAIGSPASSLRPKPAIRQSLDNRHLKRAIDLDEILWMRDVVQLTGKHRCTIHRWMHSGVFPKKNAPRSRPTGWLRSTIERWLLGSPPTEGREA